MCTHDDRSPPYVTQAFTNILLPVERTDLVPSERNINEGDCSQGLFILFLI